METDNSLPVFNVSDNKSIDETIDLIEAALFKEQLVECPLTHTFLPGMYIRKIFMPASELPNMTVIVSAIHKYDHPYFILQGKVAVKSENDGEQILSTGDHGITTSNTRRVLRIISDTIWVSCHPTTIQPRDNSEESILEAVNLVLDEILDKRINTQLEGRGFNNKITPFTEDELKQKEKQLN